MIAAIVAADKNWGIGYQNELLVHIPDDLKRFKKLTTNHVVIMGRKTWESLPHKPLPNRQNIIITNEKKEPYDADSIFVNKDFVINNIIKNSICDIFIIGGGQIYKELLPYCDKVYLTRIHKSFDNVDTYFPNLDELDDWYFKCSHGEKTYKDFSYEFIEYDRF